MVEVEVADESGCLSDDALAATGSVTEVARGSRKDPIVGRKEPSQFRVTVTV